MFESGRKTSIQRLQNKWKKYIFSRNDTEKSTCSIFTLPKSDANCLS